VTPEIKFCGVTRREDALQAASLGASYVGVIFAGGPRQLTPERAADVLRDLPSGVRRVGVFADQDASTIARIALLVGLDVVQLHGGADVERGRAVRRVFSGDVWAVLRVQGSTLPPNTRQLFADADALLVDACVPGALGGTGMTLPWSALEKALRSPRHGGRFVLAGGLRPDNVAEAIAVLAPDVVDVSSGVEAAPGIKDHDRMRAFRDAVATVSHAL